MSSVHFDTDVGGDGTTVTDDGNPTTGLANYGWKTRFVPSLANIVSIGNYVKSVAASITSSVASAASSASAALSSKNAAATSETNAASSASAALSSKNAAATSESNAASSASASLSSKNAAATSESNAASSESAALSSKNAAATSETNAASSASAALSSKNAAATSESNAATSASSALSSLNDFKGRYYGVYASDPAIDPLGAGVGVGDLYYNSTASELRVYNGSAWVAAYLPMASYELVTNKGVANGYAGLDSGGKVPTSQLPAVQMTSEKGVANGYAGLDGSGKVPASQLPSFVDDVLEYANLAGFPATGEAGKIYIDLATNKTYRWSGSVYVEISASPGTTDSVTEGSGNLYFTAARVLATVLSGLSTATNAVITASDTVLAALGKLQKQITDNLSTLTTHTGSTSNPHSTTAAQVGAPTTGGTGATGTWGISISGNAGTASSVAWGNVSGRPTTVSSFTNDSGFLTSSTGVTTTNNSGLNSDSRNTRGVTRLYRKDDNSDYSVQTSWTGSYWRLEGFSGDTYHAGVSVNYADNSGSVAWGNVTGKPSLATPRGEGSNFIDYSRYVYNNGAYSGSGWVEPSDLGVRFAGYAYRAYNDLYMDVNYGSTLIGAYSVFRYQGVYAMGSSWKLPNDGTTTGNLYGLAWAHPNAGGAAGNLDSHGLLVLINGGFACALSNSIVAAGNVTAYSDERFKRNWRPMPDNYVRRLAQVKHGIYDRTDGKPTVEGGEPEVLTQVGLGAQSFQKLLPEAIITAKDEMQTLSVNYGAAAMASCVELAIDSVDLREKLDAALADAEHAKKQLERVLLRLERVEAML